MEGLITEDLSDADQIGFRSESTGPIVKINSVYLPERATSGSSGYDLKANIQAPTVIEPMTAETISTGVSLKMPKGIEAQIRSRSGLAAKSQVFVLNSPGTVDSDFIGQIRVILFNLGKKPYTVNPGDRIAQMVFASVLTPIFQTEELPSTERGANGFGSTGK